jgi:hypothetical protein
MYNLATLVSGPIEMSVNPELFRIVSAMNRTASVRPLLEPLVFVFEYFRVRLLAGIEDLIQCVSVPCGHLHVSNSRALNKQSGKGSPSYSVSPDGGNAHESDLGVAEAQGDSPCIIYVISDVRVQKHSDCHRVFSLLGALRC